MSPDAAAIVADLTRLRDLFDFTKGGLGEHVAEAVAVGVFEQMETQTAPDGTPWAPLSEAYAEWKSSVFPGQPMAELYRLMKDPEQLKGERAVAPHAMSVTYGTDPLARQEAVWFSEGNARQPARPFYDFSPRLLDHLAALFDERFDAATS